MFGLHTDPRAALLGWCRVKAWLYIWPPLSVIVTMVFAWFVGTRHYVRKEAEEEHGQQRSSSKGSTSSTSLYRRGGGTVSEPEKELFEGAHGSSSGSCGRHKQPAGGETTDEGGSAGRGEEKIPRVVAEASEESQGKDEEKIPCVLAEESDSEESVRDEGGLSDDADTIIDPGNETVLEEDSDVSCEEEERG